MRKFIWFAISLCWAPLAQATKIVETGFDADPDPLFITSYGSGKLENCNSTAQPLCLGAERAQSGNRSLKLNFNASSSGTEVVGSRQARIGSDVGPINPDYKGQCGGFADVSHKLTARLYQRWWIFIHPDFVPGFGYANTKLIFNGTTDTFSHWLGMGSNPMGMDTKLSIGVQRPNGINDSAGAYGANVPKNRWVCIQQEMILNDPGQPNGRIRVFLDGVLAADTNDYNGAGKAISTTDFRTFRAAGNNGTYNLVRIIRQNGSGWIYYDNLTLDDASMPLCGSAPAPVDTTPPNLPAGLTVQ